MLATLTIVAALFQIGSAEVGTSLANYDFPETQIFWYWPWRDTTTLVYSRCNASQPELGKRCVVFHQLDAYSNSTEAVKECALNLEAKLPNGTIDDIILTYGFGKDKVIVVWLENQNTSDQRQILKTSVIHVYDNCRTFEAKVHEYTGVFINLGWKRCKYLNTVVFEDTFEMVVFNDSSLNPCKSNYSHYRFDAQGRKIAGPQYCPDTPFIGEDGYSFMIPVESRQLKKGYFITNINKTNSNTELVVEDSDGHKKIEMWKSRPNEADATLRYSIANEAIGLCYKCLNSSFECWQSDQKGHIHTRALFTLDIPREKCLLNIYNLPNGEILGVFQTSCASDSTCKETKERYYLTKIGKEGLIGKVELHYDTQCIYKLCTYYNIFVNEVGQYCVGRMCHSRCFGKDYDQPAHLNTSVRCFSSDELIN